MTTNFFKELCKKSQKEMKNFLFNELEKTHTTPILGDGFIYAQGNFPVLLVAHMDTVHKELPKTFNWNKKLQSLSSPQGIGGDDRCGIFIILSILKKYNCSVLFCEDEEIGGIGAGKFTKVVNELENKLEFNYIVEFDRMNANDAVFYQCDNEAFEEFITKEFYKTNWGTYSDICDIAPALGIAAVNLSCGYYKAHTNDEYVVIPEMEASINAAMSILERTDLEKDKFEYIENEYANYYDYGWGSYSGYGFSTNKKKRGIEALYYIEYVDENAQLQWDSAVASSESEAVGMFLMEHPDLCYNDIIDIDIDYDIADIF